MTSLQLTRIDWKSVVDYVMQELSWFIERDIAPTLRTLFYSLVSLNTNQAYKQLSSASVKARKKGKLPWTAFSDENRLVLADFVEEYRTPEQYVQSHINLLMNACRTPFNNTLC